MALQVGLRWYNPNQLLHGVISQAIFYIYGEGFRSFLVICPQRKQTAKRVDMRSCQNRPQRCRPIQIDFIQVNPRSYSSVFIGRKLNWQFNKDILSTSLLRLDLMSSPRDFWKSQYSLGRLFDRLDLIKPAVSNVRPSVHKMFVRFQWNLARRYSSTSDARWYAVWVTQSKVRVTSSSSLEIWPFSKTISSAIYNGSWQLTMDS